MKRIFGLLATVASLAVASVCCAEAAEAVDTGLEGLKMNVQIGEYSFAATLEDNPAVAEFVEMMRQGPVTVEMDDYSGFEKVGDLGRRLTASDTQMTTAPGDIVLYSAHNIVMFYGSNSWAYTRIGHIDDLTDWETALGNGSVTTVFTLDNDSAV